MVPMFALAMGAPGGRRGRNFSIFAHRIRASLRANRRFQRAGQNISGTSIVGKLFRKAAESREQRCSLPLTDPNEPPDVEFSLVRPVGLAHPTHPRDLSLHATLALAPSLAQHDIRTMSGSHS